MEWNNIVTGSLACDDPSPAAAPARFEDSFPSRPSLPPWLPSPSDIRKESFILLCGKIQSPCRIIGSALMRTCGVLLTDEDVIKLHGRANTNAEPVVNGGDFGIQRAVQAELMTASRSPLGLMAPRPALQPQYLSIQFLSRRLAWKLPVVTLAKAMRTEQVVRDSRASRRC